MWTEYIWGIKGRCPAKDFNAKQKGKVKSQYYQRNLVWKTISHLTNKSHTVAAACDKIRLVYGVKTSVTGVIAAMQKDNKKYGGHADLKE